MRSFDLRDYDLVLSLSHCVAKAVRARPDALHLCYCFTPMRYVWDLEDAYAEGAGPLTRLLLPPMAAALRRWDRRTDGVSEFVAISSHIADRIRRAYGRAAEVIHPPVDCARFRLAAGVDDYYLVVSALVPYKRVDLAILAANRLGRRLVVVGQGPESRRLRALAGPNVTFLGWRSDAEVAELYARCRAVLFPAVEDYGIVPLEAAAAGRPTIALGRGGVLETMIGLDGGAEPPTAVFFGEQTVDAARRGHRHVREGRGALRSSGAAGAGRPLRPPDLRAPRAGVHRAPLARVPGGRGVLKAHSRLFEHLALATDLGLIAGCWLGTYALRFHVFGGGGDIPPFRDYALQLVPILLVWGIAYKVLDLYRPLRLGSHLSEWFDVAKASTLGVLVLIAIMTFMFRGYPYSRLVIAGFWAASIVMVSLSRAAFREALRVARRNGYNQRYAVVVGGGEPAAEVLRLLRRRPDAGIRALGLLSDKRDGEGAGVPWLGGLEEIRDVLTSRPVDMVIIALPHSEYSRLTAVLHEIGDEPVAIHLVPDLFSLASLRGGVEEFESVPFIHLRESPLYGWNRVLKRGFDLGLGTLALLVALPFMAADRGRDPARSRGRRCSIVRSGWGWTVSGSRC